MTKFSSSVVCFSLKRNFERKKKDSSDFAFFLLKLLFCFFLTRETCCVFWGLFHSFTPFLNVIVVQHSTHTHTPYTYIYNNEKYGIVSCE